MQLLEIPFWVNAAILLTAGQGLFISVLIFHKYFRLYPNRFLAALMLVFSFTLFHVYLDEKPFYDKLIIRQILPAAIFLLSPLHFLYSKYLIHRPQRIKKPEYLHFLPALMLTIYGLLQSLNLIAPSNFLYENVKSGFIPFNWLYIFYSFFYYLLTIKILIWYSKRIRDVFSNIDKLKLSWLKTITYVALAGHLIFLAENILSVLDLNFSEFLISSIISALYIYSMGYLGILKSDVLSDSGVEEITATLQEEHSDSEGIGLKYQRSGLKIDQALAYKDELLKLMEDEQLYKDSNLTLRQLADSLSITPHHLSEIINSQLNKNFYDFINSYRVNQVIEDMSNDSKQHFTLLAIGLDAGFNSKTSFNTIFKKHTGKTPSEFRSQLASVSAA